MSKRFDFLFSNAFWAIVIGSASTTLIDPNFSGQEWYVSVGKFLGLVSAGFWVTRTADRTVDTLANKR